MTSRFPLFFIIRTLREGLLEWYQHENHILPDEAWHVTPHYEQIQSLVSENPYVGVDLANNETLAKTKGKSCFGFEKLPDLVCQVPFHARSEMTPRANPHETSIRSILHHDVDIPELKPNVYDPPEVVSAVDAS